MAEISFGGLATGLPTEDLVSGLMAIERRPLDRLEAEKETEAKRLEAYKQFSSLLDDLRSAAGNLNITSEVQTTSVRLSSEENISASSNGGAIGSYDIAVAQLAQVQKTVTEGYSSSSASIFGTGTFAINDTAFTVNDTNNSLEGLMNAINSITEETGVTASIINDGNSSANYHLVLTGKDAATSFSLSHALKNAEGDAISFTASHVRTAQQAVAYVDGIEIRSNTNTISGAIPGVSINLNEASEVIAPAANGNPAVYKTTTMNLEADTDALKEKISTFVSSYNAIMEWIVSGYQEDATPTATDSTDKTDTEKSAEDTSKELSAILRGDATINDIKRNMQRILTDAFGGNGSLRIMSEIGITTRNDGTLNLNNGKLDTALNTKFNDVVKLLAGESGADGVMKKFNSYLLDVTSATRGMYADKKAKHDDAIKRLDVQISQKEPLMAKIEERIRAQFNAMELLVSNLNAQSDYLTQQMDILANLNKGN